MESEMETDIPDPKVNEGALEGRGKVKKVDYVPFNWARKAHTSDRIPIPDVTNLTFNEDRTLITLEDQTTYGQNDYVFVAPMPAPPPSHRDDIDYAPPAAFNIARIMSFRDEGGPIEVLVNWLYRPEVVSKHPENSRELFATFETGICKLTDFRGKCVVANKMEVRNLGRYCDKPSQFWISRLFDVVTRSVYDVLPVSSLKALNPTVLETMGTSVSSVVVVPTQSKKLCEAQRKRKAPQAELQSSSGAETSPEMLNLKTEWPFRYFDAVTQTVLPKKGLPIPRATGADSSPDFVGHIDVPDWPGKPLIYYTMAAHNPASGESQKLRLLEAEKGQDLWSVDTSLPWVQQMPKGYIGRGGDATANEVSLPLPNIAEFIQACQSNYASQLGVEPHNLNFIDSCCKVFTAYRGDVNKGLVEVSRFTRRSIGEPELTVAEKEAFEAAMNPFQKTSWHDVFKAVKTKPIADLSQYFWSQRPASAVTSPDEECWESDPEPGTPDVQCAVCLSQDAGEWKQLLGYVPIPARESGSKQAMCSRCARLWYRYQINWLPSHQVEELEAEGLALESELVEDSKALKAEEERRKKRRAAAQEKQEALVRKREEAKQAKAEAKASGKSAKPPARKKPKIETQEPAPEITHDEPDDGRSPKSPLEQQMLMPVDVKTETSQEPHYESEADSGTQSVRRRLYTTLSLNAVDEEFLKTISDDAPPELGNLPQNCVVCGQLDASMVQQTCASCGLNVHNACYGPGRFDGLGPWLCDCCVNSRSGLGLDTFYHCVVCPPKQPMYTRWLNAEEVGACDVLKGTVDKTWCHLRCAVWIKNATFLDPDGLDGVDIALQDSRTEDSQCTICLRVTAEQSEPSTDSNNTQNKSQAASLSSSGIRVHCDICKNAFHVSCAAEQGYTFGFLKSSKPPQPVIRCRRHGSSHPDLRPMSYVDLSAGLTALQDYVRRCKKSKREETITATERARQAAKNEFSRVARGTAPDSSLLIGTTEPAVVHKKMRCVECGTKVAPYWLSTTKGHTCPLCYHGLHWSVKKLADPNSPAMHDGLQKIIDTIFKGTSIQS